MTSPVDSSLKKRKIRNEKDKKIQKTKLHESIKDEPEIGIGMKDCEEGFASPPITYTKLKK